MNCTHDALPNELWEKTFCFLPSVYELTTVSRVCSRWQQISAQDGVWTRVIPQSLLEYILPGKKDNIKASILEYAILSEEHLIKKMELFIGKLEKRLSYHYSITFDPFAVFTIGIGYDAHTKDYILKQNYVLLYSIRNSAPLRHYWHRKIEEIFETHFQTIESIEKKQNVKEEELEKMRSLLATITTTLKVIFIVTMFGIMIAVRNSIEHH